MGKPGNPELVSQARSVWTPENPPMDRPKTTAPTTPCPGTRTPPKPFAYQKALDLGLQVPLLRPNRLSAWDVHQRVNHPLGARRRRWIVRKRYCRRPSGDDRTWPPGPAPPEAAWAPRRKRGFWSPAAYLGGLAKLGKLRPFL